MFRLLVVLELLPMLHLLFGQPSPSQRGNHLWKPPANFLQQRKFRAQIAFAPALRTIDYVPRCTPSDGGRRCRACCSASPPRGSARGRTTPPRAPRRRSPIARSRCNDHWGRKEKVLVHQNLPPREGIHWPPDERLVTPLSSHGILQPFYRVTHMLAY